MRLFRRNKHRYTFELSDEELREQMTFLDGSLLKWWELYRDDGTTDKRKQELQHFITQELAERSRLQAEWNRRGAR